MKNNQLLIIGVGVVAAYFGYKYAVENFIIPDYLGIMEGYPRTSEQLQAVVAALLTSGAGAGASNGAGAGSGGAGTQTGGTGAGTSTGNGAGANGAGNGANSGTASAPGGSRTGASAGQATTVKDQIWNKAKSEAQANGSRLNFWQWNYYLPTNFTKPDPFAMGDAAWAGTPLGRSPINEAEVIGTPLTLDQYYAIVKGPLGLSGGIGSVNHWGMQASAWSGYPSSYRSLQ